MQLFLIDRTIKSVLMVTNIGHNEKQYGVACYFYVDLFAKLKYVQRSGPSSFLFSKKSVP